MSDAADEANDATEGQGQSGQNKNFWDKTSAFMKEHDPQVLAIVFLLSGAVAFWVFPHSPAPEALLALSILSLTVSSVPGALGTLMTMWPFLVVPALFTCVAFFLDPTGQGSEVLRVTSDGGTSSRLSVRLS
jgi:hypothetical protein